jgi:hypothetical protein
MAQKFSPFDLNLHSLSRHELNPSMWWGQGGLISKKIKDHELGHNISNYEHKWYLQICVKSHKTFLAKLNVKALVKNQALHQRT